MLSPSHVQLLLCEGPIDPEFLPLTIFSGVFPQHKLSIDITVLAFLALAEAYFPDLPT
jgi:hypothetical protein